MYDPCAYDKRLDESTSVLSWLLDPNKFYNCNECRIELGTVGGNNVSRFNGNLVDLESDLRNQTRQLTQCPSRKFMPGTVIQGQSSNDCDTQKSTTGLPCGSLSARNDNVKHLPACQIVQYKPRPADVGYDLKYPPCDTKLKSRRAKRKQKKERKQRYMGQLGVAPSGLANY